MEEWEDFMNKWWIVLASKTEDEFEENWTVFDNDDAIPTPCKTYVWNTWILDHKASFIQAWTNQLLHLGTVDSSRVEGAHRIIKTYIKQRNYDLRQTWKKIKICVEQQIKDLAVEDERSRISTLVIVASKPLYQPILRKATRSAFTLIERQRCLPLQDDETELARRQCTGVFTKTIGLPCGHVLRAKEAAKEAIQLHDLHRHWHINREPIGGNGHVEYNPIFNPEPGRRVAGRPTARSGRVLSAHEVVEQRRRLQVRHCSLCTPRNHNKMLCNGTCNMSTHTVRNCPAYPALPPVSQPLASPATPRPWIIPGGPGLVQNTQSATQNWVFGPSSGPPSVVTGAGYPALSQSTYSGPYYPHGGHLQVPGTQYSQF